MSKKLSKKKKKYSTKSFDSWSNSFDKYSKHSRFWIGTDDYIHSNIMEGDKTDVIKLLGFQRAVGNFVRIVTGRDDIQVKYSTKDNSYTDGKTVVLSSKVDDAKFDTNVGLALHEGSHCVLTDFKLLQSFFGSWNRNEDILAIATKYNIDPMSYQEARTWIKDLWNIIEDRRIDNYIFKNAPGYKGYYQAMYDEYFNAESINVALMSGAKCTETMEDYMFHICNITNPNRRLGSLKGLREIWNVIDLPNISRLKSSMESLDVAFHVYSIILKHLDPNQAQQQQQQPKDGQGESGSGDGEGDDHSNDSDDMPADINNLSPKEQKAIERALKTLEKDIQKQKDFIRDNVKKKDVSKKAAEELEQLGNSDISTRDAGYSIHDSNEHKGTTQVVLIKGMNEGLLGSEIIEGLFSNYDYGQVRAGKTSVRRRAYESAVSEGIALGALLGRRLKVRTEDRTLTSTRLAQGKISKRLVNELGYGNANVFEKTLVTYTKPAMVHVSIDASGSMMGSRFASAVKTAIALAKAGTMISNLRVVISLRGTTNGGQLSKPIIWIPYDSNVNNFARLVAVAPYFYPNGSTPESLCYEAIMKDMIKSSAGVDSYLINLSDGEPGYSNNTIQYSGIPARNHCARIMKTYTNSGIKVLSYFVEGDHKSERSRNAFQEMYGKSASFIDVNELNQLSITLNKLFATGESVTA